MASVSLRSAGVFVSALTFFFPVDGSHVVGGPVQLWNRSGEDWSGSPCLV